MSELFAVELKNFIQSQTKGIVMYLIGGTENREVVLQD